MAAGWADRKMPTAGKLYDTKPGCGGWQFTSSQSRVVFPIDYNGADVPGEGIVMSLIHCLILSSVYGLLTLSSNRAEEVADPQIQAVIDYFARHEIKIQKDKEWGGWIVTAPKYDGYYIVLNFKSFPTQATEKEMQKTLRTINLAHMLNVPARLAMSYPGLRGDTPGEPKYKAPALDKLPIKAKMEKLFMEYRPAETKK